jgi:hypothetical protein
MKPKRQALVIVGKWEKLPPRPKAERVDGAKGS